MKMVSLGNFIEEEVNSHVKDLILEAIRVGRKSDRHEDVLIFNKYSLEFDFVGNRVTIFDDVFAEDTPLQICMDEFLVVIQSNEKHVN